MRILITALALFFSAHLSAEPIEQLAPLAPFTGKTWRTVDGSVDGSENFSDISKWEWILHGRVVRITHSVGGGSYAGESLIHWDDVQGKIIYRYVTTAGFYTDGVITPVEGGIDVHEFIRGSKGGPTETLSGYRIENGQMHGWSKLLTDGVWSEANTFVYEEAPDAVPNID